MTAEVQRIGCFRPLFAAELLECPVLLVTVDTVDGIPAQIETGCRHCIALVLMDARNRSPDELSLLWERMISNGVCYFCAWGPDCSQVDDAFDACEVEAEIESGAERPLIMTTWHANEPIEKAVEFARLCAVPTEAFRETCRCLLIVQVGYRSSGQELGKQCI